MVRFSPWAMGMARKAMVKSASLRSRPRCAAVSRLTLRQDLRLDYPRAETPTHYMTMAMDPDLDQCVVRALRDMIVLLGEKRNLSREDAYTLCSLAADLRVTQTVNGSKGIHCMIAKTVVHG